MTIRSRFFATVYVVIVGLLLTMAGNVFAAANQPPLEKRSMDFVLVRNHNCQESCVQWISAEGEITAGSPMGLRKLLKKLKGRKLPVVFQSIGGNVSGALSIGRMIRAAGLETVVGRTQLKDCPMLLPRCPEKIVKDGWSEGEVHAGGAYCFSACPFALAGGETRTAAVNASIAVHQITNGTSNTKTSNPGRRRLDEISTTPSPALKADLASYLDEMGVSHDDVFAMMGLATPQGLYHVGNAEALKSGLITKVFSYDDEPGYVTGGTDAQRE
ncbi:hypothetical protein FHT86_002407 [Rhizobium sp. BK313]|uniref:COG3904 family protein n=1 Tax=Rhizobium sp. BK313 TaxID=2587081 RepID=UPI00106177DD|nr:hypothetical protein [Rhizobium sp. BK313]MBB3454151.1 hypothetical protein [Rhizobium sp. BK313]